MDKKNQSKVFCQIVQWSYSRPSIIQTVVVLLFLCGLAVTGESLGASRVAMIWVVLVLVLPVTVVIHVFAARGAMPKAPLASGLGVSEQQLEHDKPDAPPKSFSAGQGS